MLPHEAFEAMEDLAKVLLNSNKEPQEVLSGIMGGLLVHLDLVTFKHCLKMYETIERSRNG